MQLLPFPGTNSSFSINAETELKAALFTVKYTLKGPLKELKLATGQKLGQRRNELWKSTCFEWFIKSPDEKNYWECNVSPGGDWNIYKLSDYRVGLTEEPLISSVDFQATKVSDQVWTLTITADLSSLKILNHGKKILVNLSTVLESQNGEKTYWSLAHTQKQADFHHPSHFVLEI
jgi:hypothetical protein